MNTGEAFLNQTYLQALGWTLIHFLWQGVVLAGLLAAVLEGLKNSSAQSRYLAGCVAILLMGFAPIASFRYEVESTRPTASDVSSEVRNAPPVRANFPQVHDNSTILSIHARAQFMEKAPQTLIDYIVSWFVAGWFFGVFLLSIRLFLAWCQVQWWKKSHHEPLDSIWLAKLHELQNKLGIRRKIALLKSSWLDTPAVIGWWRPLILVPASALSGLTPAQLEAILIHELSHIRRHDYLVNLLQSAVETLLFYHPAIWWVSSKIREERENCCDDIAVKVCGDRFDYARALTTLEHLRGETVALVLAADGASISQRIRRIVGAPNAARLNLAWVSGALGAVALMGMVQFSRALLFANELNQTPAAQAETSHLIPPTAALPVATTNRVIQSYPADWNLVRKNLKNFVSDNNRSTGAQLQEYFASRGISVMEREKEGAEEVEANRDAILFQIDEASNVLRVELGHAEMGRFEEAWRRLVATFDQIVIDIKWAEVNDPTAPTNVLQGLLNRFAADEEESSRVSLKPCLGAALKIQFLGTNRTESNNIATKGSQPVSAILTEMQFTDWIRFLEQQRGVDILSAPKITTLSGREARISVEEAQTVITGIETNASGQINPITMQMMFGPTTDILPELSANRSEIKLKIIDRIREFGGYRKPNSKEGFQIKTPSGETPPQPRIFEQYYETTETIRIGETVMLGGLTTEHEIRMADEVPVLRDIPMLGRLFRHESTGKQWNSKIVMVTPKLANSYGDRLLEQRGGVDLLSAPKIKSLSERKTRVSVEDVHANLIDSNDVLPQDHSPGVIEKSK